MKPYYRMNTCMRFEVRPIDKATARDIIVSNHYSHNWNTAFGVFSFGVFDDEGIAGALVYGNPMNTAAYGGISTLPQEALTELNRMWIDDRLGRNTESAAIAKTFRWLREHSPVQLVQTFADGRLGVGTVYKAANFTYYGHDETLFFRDRETGTDYHGVPLSNTAVVTPMLTKNHLLVQGRLEAFTVKTHRYLYPLTRYAKRAIKLAPQPYPTYERGETWLPDYRPPASQIARCLVMADALGYRDMASDFDAYLHANYPPAVIGRAIADARVNEWIAPMLAAAAAQPDLFGEAVLP